MSQPREPYRGDPRRPNQQPYGQPPYRQPPQHGQQQPYRQDQYGRPQYDQQPYDQTRYEQPRYERPYGEQPHRQQPQYAPRRSPAAQEPPARQAPPARSAPPPVRAPRRIPGLGLLLTLASTVVQVLSLTVLPWVSGGGNGSISESMPKIWKAATDLGQHGFGASYVVLFSYPLAALGIVLALATVLESVALKVIWAGLTLVGLGVLVLRYGFGPFAQVAFTDKGLHFSRQEIIIAVVAAAALIAMIFVLKMAVTMFRRVAGLILLGVAAVHVAAVIDLAKGSDHLSIGAYGPAVGYVLAALAAFIGPRKLPGV